MDVPVYDTWSGRLRQHIEIKVTTDDVALGKATGAEEVDIEFPTAPGGDELCHHRADRWGEFNRDH